VQIIFDWNIVWFLTSAKTFNMWGNATDTNLIGFHYKFKQIYLRHSMLLPFEYYKIYYYTDNDCHHPSWYIRNTHDFLCLRGFCGAIRWFTVRHIKPAAAINICNDGTVLGFDIPVRTMSTKVIEPIIIYIISQILRLSLIL